MTKGYQLFDDEIREKYKELGIKHLNQVKFGDDYAPYLLTSVLRKKNKVQEYT